MSGAEDDKDKAKAGRLSNDPLDGTEPIAPKLTTLNDAMKGGAEIMFAGKPVNPLRMGFDDLDEGMRRYGPKEVTMLAADSGVGKSTLSTQAALHVAACGYGVVYFNLEMPDEMYGLRTGANFAKVSVGKAAASELETGDINKMINAFQELSEPAKRIKLGNPREHRTAAAMKALCAEAKLQLEQEGTPLRLVVVDHVLQVLVPVKSNDKDGQGQARADLMKEIAEEFGVHVLALIHITRDGSKSGKMPTKNDLAGSAWFDRHADNIFIFHQKRNLDGTFVKNIPATLSVQKCRWGSPFAIELEYMGGFFFPWALGKREAI